MCVIFDNLDCFGDGEVKPFAVARYAIDFAVQHLQMEIAF